MTDPLRCPDREDRLRLRYGQPKYKVVTRCTCGATRVLVLRYRRCRIRQGLKLMSAPLAADSWANNVGWAIPQKCGGTLLDRLSVAWIGHKADRARV